MSALLLEKNGWVSSSKQSKHIKAKYFLIKDYYDAGEVDLRYCSTDTMWADVVTKPLQGQTFRDMHAFLQNCLRDYDDDLEQDEDKQGQAWQSMNHQVKTNASLRECVEEQQKTWNLPVSQPQSHSPNSVAKLGLAELDFCVESDKYTQNPPNRDWNISVKYTKPPKQRPKYISKIHKTPQTETKIYQPQHNLR